MLSSVVRFFAFETRKNGPVSYNLSVSCWHNESTSMSAAQVPFKSDIVTKSIMKFDFTKPCRLIP